MAMDVWICRSIKKERIRLAMTRIGMSMCFINKKRDKTIGGKIC